MFKAQLEALQYPEFNSVDINDLDQVKFRQLILWLEKHKFKKYKASAVAAFQNADSLEWAKAYEQYKRDFPCPVTNNMKKELEWFLEHAIQFDNVENVSAKDKTFECEDLFDEIDSDAEAFKKALLIISRVLNITPHSNSVLFFNIVKAMVKKRIDKLTLQQLNLYEKGIQFSMDVVGPTTDPKQNDFFSLKLKDLKEFREKIRQLIAVIEKLTYIKEDLEPKAELEAELQKYIQNKQTLWFLLTEAEEIGDNFETVDIFEDYEAPANALNVLSKLVHNPNWMAQYLHDFSFEGEGFEKVLTSIACILDVSTSTDQELTFKTIREVICKRLTEETLDYPDLVAKKLPLPLQESIKMAGRIWNKLYLTNLEAFVQNLTDRINDSVLKATRGVEVDFESEVNFFDKVGVSLNSVAGPSFKPNPELKTDLAPTSFPNSDSIPKIPSQKRVKAKSSCACILI